MKLKKGYQLKIAGRPSGDIKVVPVSERLVLNLEQHKLTYTPAVENGTAVNIGDPIAHCQVEGGMLSLPAPASGKVEIQQGENGPEKIVLTDLKPATDNSGDAQNIDTLDLKTFREIIAANGLWSAIWSSAASGVPALDAAPPLSIIVNCLAAEPFRTRGKTLLRSNWRRIVAGVRALPRMLGDYGTVDIVLTDREDPVARMMYTDLPGCARVQFHEVPVRYPVENPRGIVRALVASTPRISRGDDVWVIDAQTVDGIGAKLSQGTTLAERIVVAGGPGCSNPTHLKVTIGTPMEDIVKNVGQNGKCMILRGGLLTGVPIDPSTDSVQYDDDAFFFLPEEEEREFLAFVRPGFWRASCFPCFASTLTGAKDKEVSTSLRGEQRPCIACGACENACPVDLMPQILHRYLYRGALDEAAAAGLDRCIGCNLCTYVCPSKREIRREIAEAQEQLRLEREEAERSRAEAEKESEKDPEN